MHTERIKQYNATAYLKLGPFSNAKWVSQCKANQSYNFTAVSLPATANWRSSMHRLEPEFGLQPVLSGFVVVFTLSKHVN